MTAYETRQFINGEFQPGQGPAVDVINPATASVIATVNDASDEQVEAALASARLAFDKGPWPQMSTRERVGALQGLLAYLQEHQQRLVEMIIAETGCTRMVSQMMQFSIPMKHAAKLLEDALEIKPELTPIEVSPAMDGSKVVGTSAVIYEPVGVVTAITPYNFPFFLNIVKIFHAAVMGNTVLLKPSPLTPLQALVLGEAIQACGLPAGVVNIIHGDLKASERITSDPRVDMVSFTGSDKVGALIMAQAAPTLKKVHMELGGKSALIVRADADIQEAAMAGLMSFTLHGGQGCALTTRHLVHNSVREQYVQTLCAMLAHVQLGDPSNPATGMGPLIRPNAVARCEHYVQEGLKSGASLVFGGSRPEGMGDGFYFQPTLFNNVSNDSTLAQEEIFGPIAAVIGFDTDEEAIEMANHSDFGLSGAIYSKDVGAAYEMALRLRTGGVLLNGGAGTMLSSSPFGGYKRSGFGREYGKAGLLDFCQIKSIAFKAG